MLRSVQAAVNSSKRLNGLIAATFTPFTKQGDVDTSKVPAYVDYLHDGGVMGTFVCGTTGEGPSLSLDERKKVAESWVENGRGKLEKIIIHVGSSSLQETKNLALHAGQIGAHGIGSVPPYFMKNIPLDGIVKYLSEVAACNKHLPFYYYHYPNMTAVNYTAKALIEAMGAAIPNLAGLKFTSHDLKDACTVANMEEGRFQVLGGFDDLYLARLSMGIGDACIGVSYNFAPRVALRLLDAYNKNDMDTARLEQWRLQQISAINLKYSTGSASREFMEFVGLPLGPPRLPLTPISDDKKMAMRQELENIGFFDWYK